MEVMILDDGIQNSFEPMLDKDMVMGSPVRLDNVILVPIIHVSYGYGGVKGTGGAGVSLKPTSLLVVRENSTELFDLDKTGQGMQKILEMIPQIISLLNKDQRGLDDDEPLP